MITITSSHQSMLNVHAINAIIWGKTVVGVGGGIGNTLMQNKTKCYLLDLLHLSL